MRGYIPLIPPIDKPFVDLSATEVEVYFDWFLSHIDERTSYLCEKIAKDMNISITNFDYSVESLKLVWKWFLSVAELAKTPRIEILKMKQAFPKMPNSFINQLIGTNRVELSVFSHFVLRDIGMYLGKVLKQNYPVLQWTVKTTPKNYISINEPLLVGFVDDNPQYPKPFYPDLEPVSFVEGCALNILDGTQHEEDLYNMCVKWIRWIPKDNKNE